MLEVLERKIETYNLHPIAYLLQERRRNNSYVISRTRNEELGKTTLYSWGLWNHKGVIFVSGFFVIFSNINPESVWISNTEKKRC